MHRGDCPGAPSWPAINPGTLPDTVLQSTSPKRRNRFVFEVVNPYTDERHLPSTIRDVRTGATRVVDTRALFIMVGAAPNTEWLSGLVKLDDKGFVITGSGAGSAASPFATSLPGILAVGDVRAGSVKLLASSVGERSVVISKVWEFVNQ